MNLGETVDFLTEEFDLERSKHVREVRQSVAELRDCQISPAPAGVDRILFMDQRGVAEAVQFPVHHRFGDVTRVDEFGCSHRFSCFAKNRSTAGVVQRIKNISQRWRVLR
jgi:hypothetical protein